MFKRESGPKITLYGAVAYVLINLTLSSQLGCSIVEWLRPQVQDSNPVCATYQLGDLGQAT